MAEGLAVSLEGDPDPRSEDWASLPSLPTLRKRNTGEELGEAGWGLFFTGLLLCPTLDSVCDPSPSRSCRQALPHSPEFLIRVRALVTSWEPQRDWVLLQAALCQFVQQPESQCSRLGPPAACRPWVTGCLCPTGDSLAVGRVGQPLGADCEECG